MTLVDANSLLYRLEYEHRNYSKTGILSLIQTDSYLLGSSYNRVQSIDQFATDYLDEWYYQKIKAKLEGMPDISREIKVRRTEQKIVMIVRQNSKNGIGHSRLANIAGIDRKNLRRHTKRLIAKELTKRS